MEDKTEIGGTGATAENKEREILDETLGAAEQALMVMIEKSARASLTYYLRSDRAKAVQHIRTCVEALEALSCIK